MNKFQKIAYQIAKDDKNKGIYKHLKLQKLNRSYYSAFKRDKWPFEKCKDFKVWSMSIKI